MNPERIGPVIDRVLATVVRRRARAAAPATMPDVVRVAKRRERPRVWPAPGEVDEMFRMAKRGET